MRTEVVEKMFYELNEAIGRMIKEHPVEQDGRQHFDAEEVLQAFAASITYFVTLCPPERRTEMGSIAIGRLLKALDFMGVPPPPSTTAVVIIEPPEDDTPGTKH